MAPCEFAGGTAITLLFVRDIVQAALLAARVDYSILDSFSWPVPTDWPSCWLTWIPLSPIPSLQVAEEYSSNRPQRLPPKPRL